MTDILDYIDGALPEQEITPANNWCPIACKNGIFFEVEKPLFNAHNSLINRTLAFTDKSICSANEPYMWNEHYNIVAKSVRALFSDKAEFIKSNDLHRKVEIFISKNHYPSFSRITLMVWQSELSEQIEWIMLQEKLKTSPYEFEQSSLVLGVYDEVCKPCLPIAGIGVPTVVDVFAERWRKEHKFDAVCYVDSEKRIVDTSAGNIYLIIGNQMVGVNPNYGGRNDALSVVTDRIAARNGLELKYINGFQRKNIESADEIMVVSSAYGVKCVVGVDNNRYRKQKTEKLAMLVSEYFTGA